MRAIVLRIGESALKRRLAPIEAKLIDPGRAGVIDPSDRAWRQWQAEDLQTSIREGSEPHTRLSTQSMPTYRATWGAEAWAWFLGAGVVAAVGPVMTGVENMEAIVDGCSAAE